jgi:hypothetical protein
MKKIDNQTKKYPLKYQQIKPVVKSKKVKKQTPNKFVYWFQKLFKNEKRWKPT